MHKQQYMKQKMKFYKDELIKVWRRVTYEVNSQNKEEILKMIKNDELDISDSEILFETEEIIETEILDEDLELIMKLE